MPAQDLYARSQDRNRDRQAKICMHMGTFVFHFKSSTLPRDGKSRADWHMPTKRAVGKPRQQQQDAAAGSPPQAQL